MSKYSDVFYPYTWRMVVVVTRSGSMDVRECPVCFALVAANKALRHAEEMHPAS